MDTMLYKLDAFEGPLDLLLHLITKNKVSIYDIPIVEITAQYLEAIQGIEEAQLENTSEFLVMAAQLLYITPYICNALVISTSMWEFFFVTCLNFYIYEPIFIP